MKAKLLVATLIVGGLLGCWGGAASAQVVGAGQQSFAAFPPQNPAPDNAKPSGKEKHWSGTLVDFGCMVKALQPAKGGVNAGPGLNAPQSNFMGGAPQAGHAAGGMSGSQGSGGSSLADDSGLDQNHLAQVARVDSAAKQCGPTTQTQNFGLATSEGEVLKFDAQGNSLAGDALKQTENGKRVKARVSGTLDSHSNLVVASIDIKSKEKH